MSKEEKKPLKGGEEKRDGEKEEEEKPGCWDQFLECFKATIKVIYKVMLAICQFIADCLAFCIYPIKERCCGCVEDIDRQQNPWKDPNYTNI